MAEISAAVVKQLRDRTNAGVMECRKALEESNGDIERAIQILQEQGAARMAKRADRETSQGLVEAYVHGGRIGALVELNCESDFVARTDAFKALAHDLAMQVAATNPKYVDESQAPPGTEEDPKETVLLLQPFIKDASQTVGDLVKNVSATTGEVIRVRRFARFELGGD